MIELVGRVSGIFVMLLAITLTYPALANEAAALVTQTKGDMSPSFEPYLEIPKNTTIAMTAESELTFVHYQSCRQMTVAGPSEVFVGLVSVEVPRDRVVTSRKLKKHCVTKSRQRKKGAGKAAVLVMRATPRRISTQPEIVLAGNVDRVRGISILKNGQPEATLDRVTTKLSWPQSNLELGAEYEIILTLDDSKATTSYSLIPNSDAEADQIILLSVD